MHSNKYCFLKKAHGNLVRSVLAISSLLFVVSGCDSTTKEIKPTDNVATNTSIAGNSALSNRTKVQLTGAVPITTTDAENLVQSSDNVDNNIKYMKVAESGLPEFEIDSLKRDFDNLNKYGSYSRGKITHEFTKAGDLKVALKKNNGLKNILKKLSFTPTDIEASLGNDFKLVGADYSGALNKGKFNSIFRYYENNDGKRFEINEMYLTPENNYSLHIYIESLNFYLAGHLATLQNLKSVENKEIYNLDFNVNKRVFSISSEGLNYSEFLQTSIKIADLADLAEEK
jgi:hypothetical protein